MTRPRTPSHLRDDGRRPRCLAQDGELPDVIARLVPMDEPLRCRRVGLDDPDRALDDDDELVAQVALMDDRGIPRVEMFRGGQRDALEILGLEALEQRHPSEQEHRLEVAEGATRLRHLRPSCHGLVRQAHDPRIVIIEQGAHDGIAILRVTDLVLEQPDERAGQASITGRIERLDRLRPDLGVVRSKAPAEDAACLRRTEDHERAERLVLDPLLAAVEDVAQEVEGRLGPHRRVGLHTRQDRPRPPEAGRPLEALDRPADDGLPDVRTVAAECQEGGLLGARRAVEQDVGHAVRCRFEPGERSRCRASDRAGVVVEGGHDRRHRIGTVGNAANASTTATRTLGDGSPSRASGGVDRGGVAQAADGSEARHACIPVGILEQLGDEPFRAGVRAARSEQAGHRGATAGLGSRRGRLVRGSPTASCRRPPRRAPVSQRHEHGPVRSNRDGLGPRRRPRS